MSASPSPSTSSPQFRKCCEYPLVSKASPVRKRKRSSKLGPAHQKGPETTSRLPSPSTSWAIAPSLKNCSSSDAVS